MSGLFPFVSIDSNNENKLKIEVMNDLDSLTQNLRNAISSFEENVDEVFEIEDCSDPDVVEFITPAFNQFLEGLDLDDSDLEMAETMTVYSAAFVEEPCRLILFVQFGIEDGDYSEDEDDSEDGMVDTSEEEWD